MNIKPLRDKIIVKPLPRITSTIDISMMQEAESVGYVVALGDEAASMGLKMGDRVRFGNNGKEYKDEYLKFDKIKIDEDQCLKMSWQDVCFVEELEDEIV
jgi:co-chaperonin GroES (HSP10)